MLQDMSGSVYMLLILRLSVCIFLHKVEERHKKQNAGNEHKLFTILGVFSARPISRFN